MVAVMILAAALAIAPADADSRIMAAAVKLAGIEVTGVPLVLSADRLVGLSSGVEGWTTFDEKGNAVRVFIYTGSTTFRCVDLGGDAAVCLLKLASVLAHEAWHFKHGPSEDGAYEAQLEFLHRLGAPPRVISDVRQSYATVMYRNSHRLHIHGVRH